MEPLTDRLPLVIGVTGHRDLRDEDVPQLERAISTVISELRRDYIGAGGETPIIVMSALAEGADRVVARVALAQGAHLIAPLPLPLDEYRRDFDPGLKPGNAEEFERLLAQAIAAPVMPFTPGNSLEGVRTDHNKRAEQYRAVGLFITQHCHLLLALWDGDDADRAVGGTAEVVMFKRGGIPLIVSGSPRASLDASEIGPVLHVVTPRNKATSTADKVAVAPWGRDIVRAYRGGFVRRLARTVVAWIARVFRRELDDERTALPVEARRELETWERFSALILLTRQFNIEAAALARWKDGPARMEKSIDYLFTDADTKVLDPDARKHAVEMAPRWCRLYAIADTLAQERQAAFKWDWKVLFSVGYFAFCCFAISVHGGIGSKAILAAYSLSFVVILVLFLHARVGRHQERFLDYRALAEALRVAVYWKLLGIGSSYRDAKAEAADHQAAVDTNPVGVIANAYPIKQPSELAWVKICLRTLERLDKPDGVPAGLAINPVGHGIARRFWVRGQFAYFKQQGYRHNSFAEAIETYSAIVALLSPFLLVPLLLFELVPKTFNLDHAVLIVVGLLPGVAAALTGYSERLAFTAQARQYDRMRMLFERACDLLPEQVDAATAILAHALYSELGAEAMKENAEWVAIYRQRPIQPLQ